jgi:hypothetical protein
VLSALLVLVEEVLLVVELSFSRLAVVVLLVVLVLLPELAGAPPVEVLTVPVIATVLPA